MRKFGWLFGKPEVKPVSLISRPVGSRFSAVSVIAGPRSCQAIKGVTQRRYLSAEAPRLPVPECTMVRCECRYKHHADRRAKVQRKRDREGMAPPYNAAERRSISRGRRESDD